MRKFRKLITWGMPFIILIMVAGLILSRIYQPEPSQQEPEVRITPFEAEEHTGKVAEVCGTVESADFIPSIGGEPTFLNLGRPHPEQPFTVIIWGEDRFHWRIPPEELYDGRSICVTGRIQRHEGEPQIRARNPEQIR